MTSTVHTLCARRDPWPTGDALIELERCRGTQFDPLIVDAFRTLAARTE